MEKERNELRLSSDRLETRVSDSQHPTGWPITPERPSPPAFQLSEAGISTGGNSLPATPDLRADIGADR